MKIPWRQNVYRIWIIIKQSTFRRRIHSISRQNPQIPRYVFWLGLEWHQIELSSRKWFIFEKIRFIPISICIIQKYEKKVLSTHLINITQLTCACQFSFCPIRERVLLFRRTFLHLKESFLLMDRVIYFSYDRTHKSTTTWVINQNRQNLFDSPPIAIYFLFK